MYPSLEATQSEWLWEIEKIFTPIYFLDRNLKILQRTQLKRGRTSPGLHYL